jgi:pimeloyl-ACP methyl ester carboxylesterase
MMGSLSTLPPWQVTQDMNDEERARLLTLFGQMRSNRGFLHDLRNVPHATPAIRQPALTVASRNDGAVSVSHSLDLARRIPGAESVMVDSHSHLPWVGPNADQERTAVREFLANL